MITFVTQNPEIREFTVGIAFYDAAARMTVSVEAEDYEDACQEAVALVHDGVITVESSTHEPRSPFVYGVVEGRLDPLRGQHHVPAEHRKARTALRLHPEIQHLLQAVSDVQARAASISLSLDLARSIARLADAAAAVHHEGGHA